MHRKRSTHTEGLKFNQVSCYSTTEEDRKDMRECLKWTREIFAQKAFDPYRGPEILPGELLIYKEESHKKIELAMKIVKISEKCLVLIFVHFSSQTQKMKLPHQYFNCGQFIAK